MAKKLPELEIDVADVVCHLKMNGGFAEALGEVVRRKITSDAAKGQGIEISTEELQKAADVFRIDHGLYQASDMKKWLSSNGLSVEALEEYLETSLLVGKFKDALKAKANLEEYLNSRTVKSTLRELVYGDWYAKAAK